MKVSILGVLVDQTSFSQALSKSAALIKGRTHYLVTPNPEFIVFAHSHPKFKEILNRADLSIPDGVGIIWASKLLGSKISERVAGSDLGEALIGQAASMGESVFFLGGKGDVSIKAAEAMKLKFPGLEIAGVWSGDGNESGDEEALKKLGHNRIGLLLIAYGHPKQEYWIERNLSKLNVGLAMGVGGSFDFWSGEVKRAPRWLRRLGLEWLFRLILQPWRIKRQLALIKFSWLVLKQLLV